MKYRPTDPILIYDTHGVPRVLGTPVHEIVTRLVARGLMRLPSSAGLTRHDIDAMKKHYADSGLMVGTQNVRRR